MKVKLIAIISFWVGIGILATVVGGWIGLSIFLIVFGIVQR